MLPDWDVAALGCSWIWMLWLWDAPGLGCSSPGVLTTAWNAEASPESGMKEELFQLFQSWLNPDGMGMLCCIPGSPKESGTQHWAVPTGKLNPWDAPAAAPATT